MESNNNPYDIVSESNNYVPIKWYDWVIYAEAALLVLATIIRWITGGDFFTGLLIPGLVLLFWVLPSCLSKKCRKKGWNKVSAIIVTTTILGLGFLGICVYLTVWFSRNGDSTPSITIVTKHCDECGKPAPDTAKAGDRCAYCGALWSEEKTIDKR